MKRKLLIVFLLPFLTSMSLHIETVATIDIHQNKNYLSLEISMEDRYASYLLMYKGDCESQIGKGLKVHKVIDKEVNVMINGKMYKMELESTSKAKKMMKLHYIIKDVPKSIQSVKINSDMIVGTDDHAQIAVNFHLNHTLRTFKIKRDRKTIIAKY
ncbi:hypothetical protein [uncultured Aquimarina sp.]|uniref:hypothetical protein n=1 Tax=uncultured Aquimarina sp. TaxID=575652 RepID=UPI002609774E|nr:hypothetical protein [uncultured Aquimarina sp.]